MTAASSLVAVAFAVTAYAAGGPLMMGSPHGHKDTYRSTGISSKAEAKAMQINYSAGIDRVGGLPEI